MKKGTGVGKGIGFVGALQIAFIILRLIGIINWSWALVLLPIEIYGLLCAIIIAILIFFANDLKKIKGA